MPNGKVSLGYLRLQAQQRADLENNPSVSDAEWNGYINNSRKELIDKLVAAYGNDYYMSQPYVFSLTGASFYSLPDGSANYLIDGQTAPAFYKLCGVDLQYTGSPTGWVSLRNFEFIERNKYQYPNTTINNNGYTNLRYRVFSNQLLLIPIPMASQSARIWYIPEPENLVFSPCGTLVATNNNVVVTDASGITVGMSVYSSVGIQSGTTVTAVNLTTNTVTLSLPPTTNASIAVLIFWIDTALIDGIAGWEEYVIIDAAIKAAIKQEQDYQGLAEQLLKMNNRIESMAEGRDVGQAFHVSDALSINGYGSGPFGCGDGGWGDDWGGY